MNSTLRSRVQPFLWSVRLRRPLSRTKPGLGFVLFVVFVANFPMPTPAETVQQQLDAFNARDAEALVAIYADNAGLYEHPDKLLAEGTAALRERFTLRFKEPNLHATLLHRIVAGDFVIDHERITRDFPEGPGTIELTMIYEVKAARITRAWTIAGPKNLTS